MECGRQFNMGEKEEDRWEERREGMEKKRV